MIISFLSFLHPCFRAAATVSTLRAFLVPPANLGFTAFSARLTFLAFRRDAKHALSLGVSAALRVPSRSFEDGRQRWRNLGGVFVSAICGLVCPVRSDGGRVSSRLLNIYLLPSMAVCGNMYRDARQARVSSQFSATLQAVCVYFTSSTVKPRPLRYFS